MLLHTVNKSPFERDAFASCMRHAQPGASILLIEDGVYAAVNGTSVSARLVVALTRFPIYALAPDVDARGLRGKLVEGVTLVDYGGFVDLVTQHSAVQSWL
jgi:tRNA 2-thiouridine synthesizing protein B